MGADITGKESQLRENVFSSLPSSAWRWA